MDKDAIDSVKAMFEQWELYDEVIRHDYMQHQALAAAIADYARQTKIAGRALDLGCGDSYLGSLALSELPLTEYVGVDLSESALDRAARRWAESPIPAALTQSDFATFLPDQADASFDFVLGSYSIHHFLPDRKQWLLQQIGRVLKPTGCFLWSDIVCEVGEAYSDCIDRLADGMQADWTELTSRQIEMAIAHIKEADFPETEAWMVAQAAAAGLRLDRKLMEKPYFSAYAFRPDV